MAEMIKISGLVKRYGRKLAVDNISMSVSEGEIVGFLGPNGAGKSTTMNILTGYLSSTAGEVKVGGIDILENPAEAKKLIGFLPEQPPLYTEMKVIEYLRFVYELKGCKLNRDKHLDEVMKVTRIIDVADRVIGNLSKGYRQRIGIAQAIVGNPKIIVLDEPTIGLDPKQIIEIRNLIRNLGRSHTVILSTHILQEVQAVCDRIIIINAGRIVADEKTENIARTVEENRRYSLTVAGPQREVLRVLREVEGVAACDCDGGRIDDAYTYIITSERGVDVRKPVFYALAKASYPIMALEPVSMGLEEVFVRLTEK